MRGLLLALVVVVCVAFALADPEKQPNENSDSMECGPQGGEMGMCMKCKTCKKNPQFTRCINKKAHKQCKKAKGKGWCCCYNPKPNESLPGWCLMKKKKKAPKTA